MNGEYKPCTEDPPVDVQEDTKWTRLRSALRREAIPASWTMVVLERGPTPTSDDWRRSL